MAGLLLFEILEYNFTRLSSRPGFAESTTSWTCTHADG